MIKNLKSERYKQLNELQFKNKVLLTGTPLQNNISELLALLSFLMPKLFCQTDEKNLFCKETTSDSIYETKHILKMKTVLQPFVLRRLKSELDIRQRY